jgi:hypothetical protein
MKTFNAFINHIKMMGYSQTIDSFHRQLFQNCFPNISSHIINKSIEKTLQHVPKYIGTNMLFIEYAELLLNYALENIGKPMIFFEDFVDGGEMRYEYIQMLHTIKDFEDAFILFTDMVATKEVVIFIENNDVVIPML